MPERRLGLVVGEEDQGAAVRRPHRVMRVAVAVPGPLDRVASHVVEPDGVAVVEHAGEGDALAVGRPARVPGEDRVVAADRAHLAAVDVGDEHGRVLTLGVALEGDVASVGRPVRRPVVEAVVGRAGGCRAARAYGGGHDGRRVALPVVHREREPRAVRRQVEVERDREARGCRGAGSRASPSAGRSGRCRSTPSRGRRARSRGSGRRASTSGRRRGRRSRRGAVAPPVPGCRR